MELPSFPALSLLVTAGEWTAHCAPVVWIWGAQGRGADPPALGSALHCTLTCRFCDGRWKLLGIRAPCCDETGLFVSESLTGLLRTGLGFSCFYKFINRLSTPRVEHMFHFPHPRAHQRMQHPAQPQTAAQGC